MNKKWLALKGEFEQEENYILFKGKKREDSALEMGNLIFSDYFSQGRIKATVEFTDITCITMGCDILLSYNNNEFGLNFTSIGIDKTFSMFELKSLKDGKWEFHKQSGYGESM